MWSDPAYAQSAPVVGAGMSSFMQFLPLILIVAVFYFFVIRPQQQRAKAFRAKIDAVKKGDEVVTGGGLVGYVVAVHDREVALKLKPGDTPVVALKSSLTDVLTEKSPVEEKK